MIPVFYAEYARLMLDRAQRDVKRGSREAWLWLYSEGRDLANDLCPGGGEYVLTFCREHSCRELAGQGEQG